MRDRLVAVLVGLTITMVVLYGIPRAYILADLVDSQETRKVERSADLTAVVLAERERNDEVVDDVFLQQLLNVDEGVRYVAPDGQVHQAGYREDPERDDIVEVREVRGGGELTFVRSGQLIQDRIADALLPLLLTGLGCIALAAVVGWQLARRLSRPFVQLADAAEKIGRGQFALDLPHYRMAEAEAIGGALRLSATQLDDLLTREREFAANASHQLRTPITALRLTLEDLSMWPEVTPEVAEELTQALPELDRLSASIDEMLDLSRGHRWGDRVEVDLTGLIEATVARWTPQAAQAGRSVEAAATERVVAHTVAGPVAQVLDVLIENALSHGVGAIRVEVADLEKYVVVSVSDEGRAVIDHELFTRGTRSPESAGHGLGLTISNQLATALGGYLTWGDGEHTTFRLVLPGRGVSSVERRD